MSQSQKKISARSGSFVAARAAGRARAVPQWNEPNGYSYPTACPGSKDLRGICPIRRCRSRSPNPELVHVPNRKAFPIAANVSRVARRIPQGNATLHSRSACAASCNPSCRIRGLRPRDPDRYRLQPAPSRAGLSPGGLRSGAAGGAGARDHDRAAFSLVPQRAGATIGSALVRQWGGGGGPGRRAGAGRTSARAARGGGSPGPHPQPPQRGAYRRPRSHRLRGAGQRRRGHAPAAASAPAGARLRAPAPPRPEPRLAASGDWRDHRPADRGPAARAGDPAIVVVPGQAVSPTTVIAVRLPGFRGDRSERNCLVGDAVPAAPPLPSLRGGRKADVAVHGEPPRGTLNMDRHRRLRAFAMTRRERSCCDPFWPRTQPNEFKVLQQVHQEGAAGRRRFSGRHKVATSNPWGAARGTSLWIAPMDRRGRYAACGDEWVVKSSQSGTRGFRTPGGTGSLSSQ